MKRIFSALLALTMALSCLAGCSGGGEVQTGSGGDYPVDVLRLEGGTDWGTPSPFMNNSRGPGQGKMRLVFASLLEKDETGDVGWLAESWSFEGRDYTFTLHEGLSFQDGESLTTEDVAFTIDYYRQFPPVTNYLGAGEGYIIQGYTIVDERTITITVKEADADTLVNLGSFVILPEHIWKDVTDPYTFTDPQCLIGSGAYRCTAYEPATGSYEFTAYEGWTIGQQAAERILFVPVSDSILAFENGEIDITEVPADLLESYRSREGFALLEKTNDYGYKLLINFEELPQFLELELRRGLYLALDREKIVSDIFRGAGTLGSAGYVPPTSLYYTDRVESYSYDPQAAREILGDLGLSVKLLVSDDADCISMAELVRNDLQAAGIQVQVEAADSATRDQRVLNGDYELAIVDNGGWGNDPPNYMRTLFSDISKYTGTSPHYMGPRGYSDQEMTEIAEAQLYETDPEARKELFQELQVLVSQRIPLIVLGHRSSYCVYREDKYDGWMKTYAYQQAEQNRLSYMER